MGKIYNSVEDMPCHTPLLRADRFMQKCGSGAEILFKCEFYGPLFSEAGRNASYMLKKAPFAGIKEDTVYVMPSDGHGIAAAAALCAARGKKFLAVMPENATAEEVELTRFFGGEVMFTPAEEGQAGAVKKTDILKQRSDNIIELNPLKNPVCTEAQQLTTAAEILEDTDGRIDAVVCASEIAGTPGGLSATLKSVNPDLYVAAVTVTNSDDAAESILAADEVLKITRAEAISTAKEAARCEGIPAGILSGAVIRAAAELGRRDFMQDKTVVAVLPDSALLCLPRFLSDRKEQGLI